MSWYANTVLPTMEDVFADVEPPTDPITAATSLALAGYLDVAKYVKALNSEAYETVVWDAHLRSIEVERPMAFAEEDDKSEVDDYESRWWNK